MAYVPAIVCGLNLQDKAWPILAPMLSLDQAAIDAGTAAMALQSEECVEFIKKMQLDSWNTSGTYRFAYGAYDAYDY